MRLPSTDTHTRPTPDRITATWLGHASFVLRSPKGVRIVLDPWLVTNPACPEGAKKIDAAELILVTHGHSDHTGDVVSVARATGAPVVAVFELAGWFQKQGLRAVKGMNTGGHDTINGIDVIMVPAFHSSSVEDNGTPVYTGQPIGYVIRFENKQTVYFAGDTALFRDMKTIRERYAPSIAFLPIGDLYTMGPEDAAIAAEWLGVRSVVPMHYGTFPALTGTPDMLRQFCRPKGIEVVEARPGESITL